VKEYTLKLIGGPYHGATPTIREYNVPSSFIIQIDKPATKINEHSCRRPMTDTTVIIYHNTFIIHRNRLIFVHENLNTTKSKAFQRITNECKHRRF
jgi:hypothetical protein